jgi:hypothetical protein
VQIALSSITVQYSNSNSYLCAASISQVCYHKIERHAVNGGRGSSSDSAPSGTFGVYNSSHQAGNGQNHLGWSTPWLTISYGYHHPRGLRTLQRDGVGISRKNLGRPSIHDVSRPSNMRHKPSPLPMSSQLRPTVISKTRSPPSTQRGSPVSSLIAKENSRFGLYATPMPCKITNLLVWIILRDPEKG